MPLKRLLIALVLLVSMPFSALAQFIASDDLFLAPSTVPYQVYETNTIATGSSLIFDTGDVGGGSITSIQILPLLIGNPASDQGDYDAAALSLINVGNYSTFYAYQPNLDYTATVISSNSTTVNFGAPGSYIVRLNGEAEFTYAVDVDTGFLEDLGAAPPNNARDPAGPGRVNVMTPGTDLILVSTGDPTDNGANGPLAKALAVCQGLGNTDTASSLQDAINKIQAASEAAGNEKITVTLVGHGRAGSIKIDNQRINDQGDSTMTAKAFQEAIDPYVKEIKFYSCNTAEGAAGTTFLNTFASSGGIARGFTGGIRPYTDGTRSGFSANANVRLITAVAPEPGVLLLFAPGLVAFATVRRRRVQCQRPIPTPKF